MSLGNERECFTSSIARTRGAERLAEADARRSLELDAILAAEKAVPRNFSRGVQHAFRVVRGMKRVGVRSPRGPTKRPAPRLTVLQGGTDGTHGGGI